MGLGFAELLQRVLLQIVRARQDRAIGDEHPRRGTLMLRFPPNAWFMALTEPRRRSEGTLDLWELLTPHDMFVIATRHGALEVADAPVARANGVSEDS